MLLLKKNETAVQKYLDRVTNAVNYINNAVVYNTKTNEQTPLSIICALTAKRNNAFFYNKLNTFFNYMHNNNFTLVFITQTFNSNVHKNFKKFSDNEKIKDLKKQKDSFQSFFYALHKDSFFKVNDTKNRFYIKATEQHKSGVLHEHISYFIKKDQLQNFINLYIKKYNQYKNKIDLGALEICITEEFETFINTISTNIVNKQKQQIKVLTSDYEANLFTTGNVTTFKILKNMSTKELKKEDETKEIATSIVKYVVKYINKNIDEDKEIKQNIIDNKATTINTKKLYNKALFSFASIRKISFSNFIFPAYMYHNFVCAETGTPLYKDYSLYALTALKNDNKIKVLYNYKLKDLKEFMIESAYNNEERFSKNTLKYKDFEYLVNFYNLATNTDLQQKNEDYMGITCLLKKDLLTQKLSDSEVLKKIKVIFINGKKYIYKEKDKNLII